MRRRALYARLQSSVRQFPLTLLLAATLLVTAHSVSLGADWIWSPDHAAGEIPTGDCYFRKSFPAADPQRAKLTIAGDDSFEVYLNGRRIIQGEGWEDPKSYNIKPLLNGGKNVLAIKVSNTDGDTAGVAVTIELTDKDGNVVKHATDDTWKTSLRPLAFWHLPRYGDTRWVAAQSFGEQGKVAPWVDDADAIAANTPADNGHDQGNPHDPPTVANNTTDTGPAPEPIAFGDDDTSDDAPREEPAPPLPENQPQFRTLPDFEVQVLATHQAVGSLIACEFNEFHELIIARENGPLIIMVDTNDDKIPDSPRVYCDEVKNVQGILPVNGDVFVTADGPQGVGLYRLADEDRDGQLEVADTLLTFRHSSNPEETVGEHGPHGLTLGPDGNIYLVLGNHAAVDGELDDDSPFKTVYEGDIIPRFEDPTGHANGVKAPGGTVLRIPITGGKPQRIAGGLRNAYDLAFDRWGNLFTYDSDMEADEGTTWYQPTRVTHIIPGGEYGWRSGWAKWPTYWHDRLGTVVETGRGSPTGIVVYDHFMLPKKYHHNLLLADWTNGRILHADLEPDGASYTGKTDVLLEGKPLTICDLTVGPDGWVYFVTGGRDTSGAVYRLVYTGETPTFASRVGEGLAAAIRYPQFQSAWSRQEVAKIKHAESDRWTAVLPAIARTEKNSPRFRTRALDLMHLYGPALSEELLLRVSSDKSPEVRAKGIELMGWRPKAGYRQRLIDALADDDPRVRRCACEAMVRAGVRPTWKAIQPLLAADSRFESFAARRLLETMPTNTWSEVVLTTDDHRMFIQGGTALLLVEANEDTAKQVLARIEELLAGYIADGDFNDILRLAQIAIEQGDIQAEDIPGLTAALANEFPSTNVTMNRELLRLLVALNVNTIGDRYITYIQSGLEPAEQLQVALHLALIDGGWSSQQRLALLKVLEDLRQHDGGASRGGYVQNVSRKFAQQLNAEEQRLVLSQAAQMPTAAVAVLYLLPEQPEAATLDALRQAYSQIEGKQDEASQTLQIGVIAILGESGDESSMDFLRRQYPNDPNKQAFLAMSLAQKPDGPNWELLLDSLRVVEGPSAKMVLEALATVDRVPAQPEPYRQTIIRGLEMGEDGKPAVDLLEKWTGEAQAGQDAASQLAGWQKWFQIRWPQEPVAALPKTKTESKWIYDELVAHVSNDEHIATGSAHRGERVFTTAQCIKCHRYGDTGESIGPDLTNLTRRFRNKEILESIVYPSHVISDQYRSKTVITASGRQFTGIVAAGAPGEVVVLQQDGQKKVINHDDIDETLPSRLSSMPEGLLNNLSLQEVTDLFTYLSKPPQASTATLPQRD